MCLGNGQWSGDFPVCRLKRNLCPITAAQYGVVRQFINTDQNRQTIIGTVCLSKCLHIPGFVGRPLLVGSRLRVCQSNSQWSGSEPFCIDSNKFRTDNPKTVGLSTKAWIIIISVLITSIIVVIVIALVVVFHLCQKCYECCSLCLRKRAKTNDNSFVIRPESQVNITEINETLHQLSRFEPNRQNEHGDQIDIDSQVIIVHDSSISRA